MIEVKKITKYRDDILETTDIKISDMDNLQDFANRSEDTLRRLYDYYFSMIDIIDRIEQSLDLSIEMNDCAMHIKERIEDIISFNENEELKDLREIINNFNNGSNAILIIPKNNKFISQKSPLSEPTKQTDNERKPYTNEA
jgi:hypothetical protein